VDWINELLINIQQSEVGEGLISFLFQDQIVVMVEDEAERTIIDRKKYVLDIAEGLLSFLSTNWPEYQFHIGIGKWNQNTINLNKSYQEAKLALRFGQIWYEDKNIYHIQDLGILRLLIYNHQEILSDFSNEYLSLLIESDRQNGTEYIETLKAYIQYQGVNTEVSENLHVHPNTLRNRIKKMEELTGIDFQNSKEFMNLMIAVIILSIQKQ
jgi:DNA-binding PucR family transcriptional regulator